MLLSRRELVEKIKATKGFYSVQFVKRSTGDKRLMTCLNHVKKYLNGGELSFDPEAYNLIPTWSVDSKGYRSIPVEGIIGATINHQTYLVRD
jgi:hypothetical protein